MSILYLDSTSCHFIRSFVLASLLVILTWHIGTWLLAGKVGSLWNHERGKYNSLSLQPKPRCFSTLYLYFATIRRNDIFIALAERNAEAMEGFFCAKNLWNHLCNFQDFTYNRPLPPVNDLEIKAALKLGVSTPLAASPVLRRSDGAGLCLFVREWCKISRGQMKRFWQLATL